MVAALAALQAEPLLTAVAEAKFAPEVSAVVAHLPRIDSMSRLQIDQVARQTGDLLHNVVEESRREMHRFVARGFSAALADTGWTIKDEAADGQTTAYLATNNAGQTLAACIEADGKISTDMSGFRGRDCEKAIQTLFRSLEDQGIQLTRTREQPHYLFQGGGILGGATRADQVLQNTRHHHAKRETVESDGSRRRGANSRDRNRGAKRGYVLTALQKLAR
jgi:hypothetical protein